jgi:hypothetical protein
MQTFKLEEATKEVILEAVKEANGTRRERLLGESDVEKFIKLVNENQDNYSVQVRAEAVSNSYKYQADATYLRYNYKTKNVQVGAKKFRVAFGDNGQTAIKKYDYGF